MAYEKEKLIIIELAKHWARQMMLSDMAMRGYELELFESVMDLDRKEKGKLNYPFVNMPYPPTVPRIDLLKDEDFVGDFSVLESADLPTPRINKELLEKLLSDIKE